MSRETGFEGRNSGGCGFIETCVLSLIFILIYKQADINMMISKNKPKNFSKKFQIVSCFIEYQSKILLLHRHDLKPQGNTWGVPAGKVANKEGLMMAIVREVKEETGLSTKPDQYKYFDKFYVRYPEFDFVFHIFHLPLEIKPQVILNLKEHKDSIWKNPIESLKLNLISGEDFCIKNFYNL
jgi:ADP-ribose pyrophosphatase YjhB (NUDIX family)